MLQEIPQGELRPAPGSRFVRVVLFCATFSLLYFIPTLLQRALLHLIPNSVAHILIGDAAGCLLLWRIGQPRTAAAIYIVMTLTEAALLQGHFASLHQVVWLMNLVPAVAIGWVLQDAVAAVVELE